jgi:hypothetical protein
MLIEFTTGKESVDNFRLAVKPKPF